MNRPCRACSAISTRSDRGFRSDGRPTARCVGEGERVLRRERSSFGQRLVRDLARRDPTVASRCLLRRDPDVPAWSSRALAGPPAPHAHQRQDHTRITVVQSRNPIRNLSAADKAGQAGARPRGRAVRP
jgi:hypothetical protein